MAREIFQVVEADYQEREGIAQVALALKAQSNGVQLIVTVSVPTPMMAQQTTDALNAALHYISHQFSTFVSGTKMSDGPAELDKPERKVH